MLLRQIAVEPDAIIAPAIDETPAKGELPRLYAARMADEKARAVAPGFPDSLILACDTTVALGRRILPPADSAEAVARCLALLSGRRHQVISAVTLLLPGGIARRRLVATTVRFCRLTPDQIAAYGAAGEGQGKAGGYAIQGRAAAFVSLLSGSYTGVVGLPLYETRQLLGGAGYPAR